MQWLSLADREMVIARTAADYAHLASIITELSPDILAFQEVDSVEAVRAILPLATYKIFISDRHTNSEEVFPDQNQFTGFAVKAYLAVTNPPDLKTLNVGHHENQKHRKRTKKLRYGSYLIVRTGNKTELHLLNVHLKSGCFSRKYKQGSKSCRILKQQASVLSSWIRQRQNNNEDYLVLGDFNHRLNSQQQWLLTSLNDALPHTISNLTENITASCTVSHINRDGSREVRHYRSLIDHALSSQTIANTIRQSGQIYQYKYAPNIIEKHQLSDHCPLIIHIPAIAY